MADPTTLSSIGPFQFLKMTPSPPRPKLRTFKESRPGVAGYSIWLEGIRADPWQAETTVDTLGLADGENVSLQYHNYISTNQIVKYSGVLLPYWVFLEDVVILNNQETIGSVGGINGSLATGFLKAKWMLLLRTPLEDD